MEYDRIPRPQEIYRHFKGKLYQIITLAQHSESNELLVVYQALYGDFRIYARPLRSFIEELDSSKYPDASQKHRFELVQTADIILTDKDVSLSDNKTAAVTEAADGDKDETGTEVVSGGTAIDEVTTANQKQEDAQSPSDQGAYAVLMRFLEADSYSEKLDVVYSGKKYLNDRIINDMSMALDCTVEDGTLEERIESLINCLQALSRFEKKRLR